MWDKYPISNLHSKEGMTLMLLTLIRKLKCFGILILFLSLSVSLKQHSADRSDRNLQGMSEATALILN